jgi:hypothetical protein
MGREGGSSEGNSGGNTSAKVDRREEATGSAFEDVDEEDDSSD